MNLNKDLLMRGINRQSKPMTQPMRPMPREMPQAPFKPAQPAINRMEEKQKMDAMMAQRQPAQMPMNNPMMPKKAPINPMAKTSYNDLANMANKRMQVR
jgi:hypothetical protein